MTEKIDEIGSQNRKLSKYVVKKWPETPAAVMSPNSRTLMLMYNASRLFKIENCDARDNVVHPLRASGKLAHILHTHTSISSFSTRQVIFTFYTIFRLYLIFFTSHRSVKLFLPYRQTVRQKCVSSLKRAKIFINTSLWYL